MRNDKNSLRGVALKVVVDIHGDTWVGGLVVTRDSDLRWVRTTTTADVDLSTTDVL